MEKAYQTIQIESGSTIKAWINGVPVDKKAMTQLENIAKMPFIFNHIAVMPDVHVGIGATVGSVIPTIGAVIPAAVGVDIGCGMMAVRTTLTASDLPDNLKQIRVNIERAIPHGRSNHGKRGDVGAWREIPMAAEMAWKELKTGFERIVEKHPKIQSRTINHINHLGTLGTGNHFVEVCLDESQRVWFMLHSGSRGVGNRLGSYFIELAKYDMRSWHSQLPDINLSYFKEGTEYFDDYVEAVDWAQKFAKVNREIMMNAIIRSFQFMSFIPEFTCDSVAINCHHNYLNYEFHFGKEIIVTRKGAVRAGKGDLGIIPGSMGAKSYIVKGLGNPHSFESCSHGAGRKMSRTQAKQVFTVEDHKLATIDVECKKNQSVLDETPGAYKSIDEVMNAQKDLVEIVHTLKQVICVKG